MTHRLIIILVIGFMGGILIFSQTFSAAAGSMPYDENTVNQVDIPMKIKFRQTGGYAGLVRGADIDTALLPEDEALRIQALVKESGILQIESQPLSSMPDLYNYEIVITTEQGRSSVILDDSLLSEKLDNLLNYLQDQAHPVPLQR